MPLPRELWNDVVPESTTVVGNVDTFIDYVEYGDAWKDWCYRVRQSLSGMKDLCGQVSPEIVEELLSKPQSY
jgi:hypothetical protein